MQWLGTPATTALTAAGTSHTINLPGSIGAGEDLVITLLAIDSGSAPAISGFGDRQADINLAGDDVTIGVFHKKATGGEGATVTCTTSISTQCIAIASRASDLNTDPFTSNNTAGFEADEDPFTLAANVVTGLAASSTFLVVWGCQGERSLVTMDAALTSIGAAIQAAGGSLFAGFGSPVSGGNPALSNDMDSSRPWDWLVVELTEPAADVTTYGGDSLQLLSISPGPSLAMYG